ncbi:hypothetical protein [Streptosporangium sp. CA-115845]|uniref:hypothetical protein n=1 Tax=Streptosporangium sp. CA-115845 TaxID=3240071 RepID=UPI003D8A4F70
MPVRPENKIRYPADWRAISDRIRFDRAGGRCECVGECGEDHGGRCVQRHGLEHTETGSRVVLTTAHRDHQPEHCDETNLFAACQKCHLRYDADHHRANAARTREARRTAGMDPLFELAPLGSPAPALQDHEAEEMS